jgi:hypothetical protein
MPANTIPAAPRAIIAISIGEKAMPGGGKLNDSIDPGGELSVNGNQLT